MWSIAIFSANFPYFWVHIPSSNMFQPHPHPPIHRATVGSSAEPMGPALEFAHAEMLASVAEAEARYVVKDQATEYEMPRMKAPGDGKFEQDDVDWDEMF